MPAEAPARHVRCPDDGETSRPLDAQDRQGRRRSAGLV